MPWTLQAAVNFGPTDYGVYRFMTFSKTVDDLAFAVALGYPGDSVSTRLRTGFYYPVVAVGGREMVGPSEEMFLKLKDRNLAFHVLDFGFLDSYPGLASAVEVYGVGVSPDRGIVDASAALWRFRA